MDALKVIDDRLAELQKAHAAAVDRYKALEFNIIRIRSAADELRFLRKKFEPQEAAAGGPEVVK